MITYVCHVEYFNVPTKTKGVVVFDTKAEADKYAAELAKWDAYAEIHVTLPHQHRMPT